MEFKVKDWHKGDTGHVVTLVTLDDLKQYAEDYGYKAVWPDFKLKILWVTEYGRFGQR